MSVATPAPAPAVAQSTAKKPVTTPDKAAPVPAINAFEKDEKPTQNGAKISVLLDKEVPVGMTDVLACRKLSDGEFRISLKCKTDAPLRSPEAESMVERVARDIFKVNRVSFDTIRPINWEEGIQHFVAVFRIFAS